MKLPTLFFSEDSTQLLMHLQPGQARQGVEDWIGDIMETPADAYVCHAASPDICFYNTKVGERFGSRRGQQWNNSGFYMIAQSMNELRAEGTDILHLQADSAHSCGKQFIAAIRMSDAHFMWGKGYPDDVLFPTFVHENPQWRLKKPDGTPDFFMDWALPEVRSHRFAILRELAEQYAVDGFELDFMRFCRHFVRPATAENLEQMTQYLRDLRTLCNSQGRPMVIGARMPSTLAECKTHGLDPATWARKGLIDYLVPTHWLFADFSIPVIDYLAAVKDTNCRVLFSVQPRVASTWDGECTSYDRTFPFELPEYRALAATGYAAGAHGLHCFNLNCELPGRRTEVQQILRAIATSESSLTGARHYQYLPSDPPDADCMNCLNRNQRLVFSAKDLSPKVFHFQSGESDRKLSIKVGWRIFNAVPTDNWQFTLNGRLLSSGEIGAIWNGCGSCTHQYGAGIAPHMDFEISLHGLSSLGALNQLQITPLSLDESVALTREMKILEVWAPDDSEHAKVG